MYLNPDAEIEKSTGGNLPHWHQDGTIQFITFRLADSLPQERITILKDCITAFRSRNPEPWNEDVKRRYWKIIGPLEERLLNNHYGKCVLKNPLVRRIITEALHFKDTINYHLISYVIMPNHVHILVQLHNGYRTATFVHSIKRHTAFTINKMLDQEGQLWMNESFDRIVRNEEHLKYCIRYIRENPKDLPPQDYTLYIDPNINL